MCCVFTGLHGYRVMIELRNHKVTLWGRQYRELYQRKYICYMTSSVRGQDEWNPALWLERTKLSFPSREKHFPIVRYWSSFFGQDGWILASFFFVCVCFFLQLHLGSWARKKWTWPIYSLIIRQAPRAGKMNRMSRCGWLPERARWSYLARPGYGLCPASIIYHVLVFYPI